MKRNSINNKKIDDQIKLVKKLFPDGKLPKRILKEGWWKSNKEHDEFFEKVVIPQTEAMLKTAAGRRKLRKTGFIK